jgi:DNA-binding MarR family transcriptional regulator
MAIIQNLLELESATAVVLAERTGYPLDTVYQTLARMGMKALVRSVRSEVSDDAWGRVAYNYSLTGEGKNLAAMWGQTPRPRDIPIQGHTP